MVAKKFSAGATSAEFKQGISEALFTSEDIRELLFEDIGVTLDSPLSEQKDAFDSRVSQHLYIDDVIEKRGTYIFFEVVFPMIRNNTKNCEIIMYIMCNTEIINTYTNDKYFGNRIDSLLQMIEDKLINDTSNAQNFGIGNLSLDSVKPFSNKRMYGRQLRFIVSDFR